MFCCPRRKRFSPEDLELTLGYYIPAESDLLKVKFVKGLEGYLWSFPRLGHLSVGICASMAKHVSRELRALLDSFVAEEKLDMAGAELYSHILPSPRRKTLRERSVVGANWALVGDAAAWVDPVTGEGIYYAMRSGEILAEALIAGRTRRVSRAGADPHSVWNLSAQPNFLRFSITEISSAAL